jgi:hypothetical protein
VGGRLISSKATVSSKSTKATASIASRSKKLAAATTSKTTSASKQPPQRTGVLVKGYVKRKVRKKKEGGTSKASLSSSKVSASSSILVKGGGAKKVQKSVRKKGAGSSKASPLLKTSKLLKTSSSTKTSKKAAASSSAPSSTKISKKAVASSSTEASLATASLLLELAELRPRKKLSSNSEPPQNPCSESGSPIQTVDLRESDRAAIASTKAHGKSPECIRNQRHRLAEMIEWVVRSYPEYVERGTVVVTEEEREDPCKFYIGRNRRDFIYNKLDVNIIIGFMAWKKVKKFKEAKGRKAKERQAVTNPNKKDYVYSYETIRKYHDSILYGAEVLKACLPGSYHAEMKSFLDNYKKEFQGAKKAGNVDETESDPFSFSLLRLICCWFISGGHVFGWCFLLTQWNCMARSINIDCIGWHNMRRGEDSIVVKYDDTKSDKAGEKCSNKNLYSNPNDMYVCWYMALRCYCCIYSVSLAERDFLFIEVLKKIGTAADNFCKQLSSLVSKYSDVVDEYVQVHHCNVHGICKGSGTFASSCSTVPPPLVSIALRGEWSLGKVFDIYFKFGATGDHYLGRILAGLNPHDSTFGDLPPHFSCGRENKFVDRGMNGMFGNLTKVHTTTNAILLLCLPSIVHHSDEIDKVILKNPGHIFGSMYIFSDRDLLCELKKLVTQEPSKDIQNATGMSSHVVQMQLMEKMNNTLGNVCLKINEQQQEMVRAVTEAIESSDTRSGLLTLNNFEVSSN